MSGGCEGDHHDHLYQGRDEQLGVGERQWGFDQLSVILLGGGMRYLVLFALIFSVGCVPVTAVFPAPAQAPQLTMRLVCTNLWASVTDDWGRPRKTKITSDSTPVIKLGYEYNKHYQRFIADFYPIGSTTRVGQQASQSYNVEYGNRGSYESFEPWILIPDGWSYIKSSGMCTRR